MIQQWVDTFVWDLLILYYINFKTNRLLHHIFFLGNDKIIISCDNDTILKKDEPNKLLKMLGLIETILLETIYQTK